MGDGVQMNNQNAKADAGKIRPTLVETNLIRSSAKIEEYEHQVAAGEAPRMICKTVNDHGWKALFECPFCGKHFEAYISNVVSGRQHSCGCAKGKLMVQSKGTHGASRTRLYRIWCHIQERCNRPDCKEYKWYGARGVRCEFKTFEEFRDYAYANGYADHLTCERIDVNGNYAPGNVTFIPQALQARNTTRSVLITYKGLTLCASEWGEILGMHPDTLTNRKRRGWSDKRTLETPVGDSIDITLIPVAVLEAIRQTRLYGLHKYKDPENWKQVEVERYRDAAFRHFLAYLDDPYGVDEESGLPHLWHLTTNTAFLCELERGKLDCLAERIEAKDD